MKEEAKDILIKHLRIKGCTNEHIHVGALIACVDAMEEYARNRYRIGFKDGRALGYDDGYSEATSQAVKEIANNYTPNKP